VNLTTLVLLIFVFFVAYRKLDRTNHLNRSFLLTLLGVMLGLSAETITDFLNGNSNGIMVIVNNIFSVVLFVVAPIMAFNFFMFIFHLVFQGKNLNKELRLIFILPIISNVIISLLSPFFGLFFDISNMGIYSRGPLWWLSAFSTYVYVIAGIALVIANNKRMLRQDLWLILGIGFIPILGAVFQSLFYGVLAMWSSAGIALILAYLFLQDRMIRLDSLTGAWNRESFHMIYSRRIQSNPEKTFGAIYFDIDNLKMINDGFGHLEGDNAIKLVMEIIRASLPPGGIICRLGGDEFVLLYDCEEESQIRMILENIKLGFSTHEELKQKEYPLECSFGTALYTSEYTDLNGFLSRLDFLMYEEKFSKRKKA